MIRAKCSCGASFQANPQLAGKQVKCPNCGQAMVVPATTAEPQIQITCPCGQGFRVAAELAGRQGSCPTCGRALAIPLPQSETATAGSLGLAETEAAGGGQSLPLPPLPSSVLPPIGSPIATLPGRAKETPKTVRRRQKKKFVRQKRLIIGAIAGVVVLLLVVVILMNLRFQSPADRAAAQLLDLTTRLVEGKKVSALESWAAFAQVKREVRKMSEGRRKAFEKKWRKRWEAAGLRRFPEVFFRVSSPHATSTKKRRAPQTRITVTLSPQEIDAQKKILAQPPMTNSIGMQMKLIPAGKFGRTVRKERRHAIVEEFLVSFKSIQRLVLNTPSE